MWVTTCLIYEKIIISASIESARAMQSSFIRFFICAITRANLPQLRQGKVLLKDEHPLKLTVQRCGMHKLLICHERQ